MKVLLLLFCVLLGILGHHLPADEKQKLKEIHDACQAEAARHADEHILKHVRDHAGDPQVGAHLLCMSRKIGFQQENGDIVKDVLKSKIALVTNDQSKVDGLVKKCAVQKDTAESTAVKLLLCFLDNDIHYIYEF